MSAPISHFRFCPRCGQARNGSNEPPVFHCPSCDFVYYFNPAVAAGGFLMDATDRVLFIRRAHEPAQGRLGLPGGFVDAGETAEVALRREILEEVNLTVGPLAFLTSQANEYAYRGVTYPVLDFFFTGRVESPDDLKPLDGVAGYAWMKLESVDLDEIAFSSVRRATELLRGRPIGGG